MLCFYLCFEKKSIKKHFFLIAYFIYRYKDNNFTLNGGFFINSYIFFYKKVGFYFVVINKLSIFALAKRGEDLGRLAQLV